jgi:hypothetical protein
MNTNRNPNQIAGKTRLLKNVIFDETSRMMRRSRYSAAVRPAPEPNRRSM